MAQFDAVPAVVIGAGPYGLAVAAHLRGRKVPVRVFGDPMDSWRNQMPTGMFLKSTPWASNLSAPTAGYSLADYCRQHGFGPLGRDEPVPIDLFIRYGRWFAGEQVPDLEQTRVVEVRRRDNGFDVTLDTGERIGAAAVVVASGLAGFAHVPGELATLSPDGPSPKGPVSHSSQYGDLSALADAEVVVIGAGQSALETAALLAEAGARPQVVARGRIGFAAAPDRANGRRSWSLSRPSSPLGPGWRHVAVSTLPGPFRYLPPAARLTLVKRILGPSGAWWLRDRFMGRVPVREGRRIGAARLDGRRVVIELVDHSGAIEVVTADHVIAATGYRVDVDRLDFVDPGTLRAITRVSGSPRLNASFESSVPGLFFPGLAAAATFGPLQRFVCGTRFAATRVSAAVATRI
jgi:hypothetical protein